MMQTPSPSTPAADFVPFKPRNFKLDVPAPCTNLFLHARDTSNVGDLKCTPFDYFTLRGESACRDFWSTVNAGEDGFDNIVVGGGVFANNYIRMPIYYERLQPRRHLILWGAGIDAPQTPRVPKDFIDRCALVGSRDYAGASLDGEKVVFCPCASAMNSAFDISRPPPIHETVCYLHHNRPLNPPDAFRGYPVMNNYSDFTDALKFLASGKVVITNSYHGLYWATLLGRKVICLVMGAKFAHFKWAPMYVPLDGFRDALDNAGKIPAYPDALAECRSLNLAFYERVLALSA